MITVPRPTLFRTLGHRPFALLWSGQTLSRIGDFLYQIALAWWVLQKTGSAAAMGTVLFLAFAPMLVFLLVGGVVVDRLPRIPVRQSVLPSRRSGIWTDCSLRCVS
jgi:MFS family permease